jgi:hypothetical protein
MQEPAEMTVVDNQTIKLAPHSMAILLKYEDISMISISTVFLDNVDAANQFPLD